MNLPFLLADSISELLVIFNSPGIAGAVLQTPSSLIHSFIKSLTHPLWTCLQNSGCVKNPSWLCEKSAMALGGIRHLWRLASASTGGASRWRVCYQRGLPRLVFGELGQITYTGSSQAVYVCESRTQRQRLV